MTAPAVERPTVTQQHTIDVLAEIASRGLPVISWHLYADLGQLEGQAGSGSDEDKRSAVAAYAALLGVEPTVRRREHDTRIAVVSVYGGVEVTVCALVERCLAVSHG